MGAGLLVRDGDGKVLLVEPTYKKTWELPGGATEADESPAQCAAREVREELGIDVPVGRLLCVEWQGPEPDRTESLMWVYDGGIIGADTIDRLRIPADELASYRFCAIEEIRQLMTLRLSRRVEAALDALHKDCLVELEWGVRR
jgi:8-oxo-dGTP pyrophosphatase MutT (NUDIX family)